MSASSTPSTWLFVTEKSAGGPGSSLVPPEAMSPEEKGKNGQPQGNLSGGNHAPDRSLGGVVGLRSRYEASSASDENRRSALSSLGAARSRTTCTAMAASRREATAKAQAFPRPVNLRSRPPPPAPVRTAPTATSPPQARMREGGDEGWPDMSAEGRAGPPRQCRRASTGRRSRPPLGCPGGSP